ncbi:MAG: histidine kinase [Chitinophagaceae bacterium]|nr:histidine kinase [Chitinophagaceae bacterium]
MLKLPRYTTRDLAIMLWTMIPFSILLNVIIFGSDMFSSIRVPIIALPGTFLFMAGSFILYGHIAVAFRQRLPGDGNFLQRTIMMILLFLTISALLIFLLYKIYHLIGLVGDTRDENNFTWAYIVTGILNIFLTFLNEGIYRFENWKSNLKETEELKMAYKQSQLIGLKSQVNPHFLFNSLNSLSGLIQEDTEQAEKFLDEMSKVYRYMLRNDEDPLVKLTTEIQFITSYFSLLKARYGSAVDLVLDVTEQDKEKSLPPLSLQVVVENALYQNKTSKQSPLQITIASTGDNKIVIKNNVQRKILTETGDQETGLDNLIKKYQLMSDKPVEIFDSGTERRIILPLISRKEEVVA